ncbi:hypothetical protein JFT86_26930 [Pseudomonas sp. TH06]|uniref:hypothetical protein n=1 Tax=Pseudomonas sp. TH06 TaxID=2796372 RepID=UPI00191433B2|nr:hypothetical protein [Pseudomonas sp. TH06]MBK5530571.1 hypothetical protein [Pseudomonas sp. TH06]
MRESDHDCVQSHEDFTYTNPAVDPATPAPAPDDSITVEVVKKKTGSGLDSLGGGRLD